MIGRARVPQPGDLPAAQLAALRARVDQAVALVDEQLRLHGRDRRVADVLLDVRDALRPAARP